MPLPKGLPGALAALVAAVPLFAFTPAEERAIAFLTSNTNPAWRERLNLHALYSWLQARKTAP